MKGRITALAIVLAAAAAGASGCSSGGAKAANPAQLLSAAVKNAQSAHSVVATTNLQTSQIPGLGGLLGSLGLTTSGTYTGRTSPPTLREFSGTVQAAGQSLGNIDLISSPGAAYVQMPPLLKSLLHTTKPWSTVTQSQLKSGGLVSSLLSEATSVNPLSFAALLGESANTKTAGTANVNGVNTTVVTGSIPASAAISKLPSSLQSTFSSDSSGQITFQAWIDGQRNFRKLDISEGPSGGPATTKVAFTVTSLNQPVKITLPSPGQTAPLPKKALSGLSGLAGGL